MGCGCKGGKAQVISTANTPAGITSSEMLSSSSASARMAMSIADSDYEMIEYIHPNRGEHPVVGHSTGKQYGFRAGDGQEKFLVHRADIAASPAFFKVVSKIPAAPREEIVVPPPPTSIIEPEVTEAIEPPATPAELEQIDASRKVLSKPPKAIAKKALNQAKFDLQLLPGVTPNIAKSLIRAGLISPKAIIDGGPETLERAKYVGEVRAKLIFEYVTENYGDTEEK